MRGPRHTRSDVRPAGGYGKAVDLCVGIAAKLEQYATHLDDVHHKLLDLLKRLGDPSTLGSEIVSLFTGGDGGIDKIAADAKAVLGNFAHEVSAIGELVESYIEQAWAISKILAGILAMVLKRVVVAPLYNGVADVVNAAASFGNLVATDPMGAGEFVAGVAAAALGAAAEAGGTLLDVTVLGAPVA
jgi:hypothetical protein